MSFIITFTLFNVFLQEIQVILRNFNVYNYYASRNSIEVLFSNKKELLRFEKHLKTTYDDVTTCIGRRYLVTFKRNINYIIISRKSILKHFNLDDYVNG